MMIIAGTGHRPKYLPCKYDEQHSWCVDLKDRLKQRLIEANPTIVISGGALGWDMWLAEAALELGISLSLYMPFPGYEKKWLTVSIHRLYNIRDKSYFHGYAEDKFSMEAYYTRNRWMVDDADEIWALCNEDLDKSGTHQTIFYAGAKNKQVKNFWNE